jgi:hypothetical protein
MGFGVRLPTPHLKKTSLLRTIIKNLGPEWILWMRRNMDKGFGTWKIKETVREGFSKDSVEGTIQI